MFNVLSLDRKRYYIGYFVRIVLIRALERSDLKNTIMLKFHLLQSGEFSNVLKNDRQLNVKIFSMYFVWIERKMLDFT